MKPISAINRPRDIYKIFNLKFVEKFVVDKELLLK